MSDDSIRDAFRLEDKQQAGWQRHQRQAVLTATIGTTAGIAALVWLAQNRNNSSLKAPEPPAARAPLAPEPTPAPEWVRLTKAFAQAKAQGIYLDISYPQIIGRRQVWWKDQRWRDETPERVHGFDGTREWVWFLKSNRVVVWKPGRAGTGWITYPGQGYSQPWLLGLLRGEAGYSPTLKRLGTGSESHWEARHSSSAPPAEFGIEPVTYRPSYEKGYIDQAQLSMNYDPVASHSLETEPPPSFFTFPRSIPADIKQRARGKRPISEMTAQPLTTTTGEAATPPLANSPQTNLVENHTTRVTYGIAPSAGFAPPPGVPKRDLDTLSQRWQKQLSVNEVARLESLRYQAVIRHASHDASGNIYLIYTGNEITPEIFRKRLKITVGIPGYDTLQWANSLAPDLWHSSLNTILPHTKERLQLRQLTLIPLRRGTPAPEALTVLWTETKSSGQSKTNRITIPLTKEPDGPECMTAVSGPPTDMHRRATITKILQAANQRALGWKIATSTADQLESLARETWHNSPPPEILALLGQLELAAGRHIRALEFATQSKSLYQQQNPGSTTYTRKPYVLESLLQELKQSSTL